MWPTDPEYGPYRSNPDDTFVLSKDGNFILGKSDYYETREFTDGEYIKRHSAYLLKKNEIGSWEQNSRITSPSWVYNGDPTSDQAKMEFEDFFVDAAMLGDDIFISTTIGAYADSKIYIYSLSNLDTDDVDGDDIKDLNDNCIYAANYYQFDFDSDGKGDFCDQDEDSDGVIDTDYRTINTDLCQHSEIGYATDGHGCTIDQYISCNGSHEFSSTTTGYVLIDYHIWTSHKEYVDAYIQKADEFLSLGLISEKIRKNLIREAKKSSCGRKSKRR